MTLQKLKSLRSVHIAIMVSPLALFVVLQVLSLEAPAEPSPLVMILRLLALVQIPLIPVLRKAVMGSVALGGADIQPGATEVDEAALNQAIEEAAQRYFTGTLIGSALAESIAVFGFVAGFLGGDASAALPFLAGSMVLIAIQYPREQSMLSLIDAPLRSAAQRRLQSQSM